MSTEIEGYPSRAFVTTISTTEGPLVVVRNTDDNGLFIENDVPRDELLDAIRTELNVIVIDRAELPEVTVDGGQLKLPGTAWPTHLAHKNLAAIKSDALDGLALAEHLEANPPKPLVTDAIALLVNAHGVRGLDADRIARALVTHFDIKEPS